MTESVILVKRNEAAAGPIGIKTNSFQGGIWTLSSDDPGVATTALTLAFVPMPLAVWLTISSTVMLARQRMVSCKVVKLSAPSPRWPTKCIFEDTMLVEIEPLTATGK